MRLSLSPSQEQWDTVTMLSHERDSHIKHNECFYMVEKINPKSRGWLAATPVQVTQATTYTCSDQGWEHQGRKRERR